MSWSAWTENGFGFPLLNDHNEKKIKEFLIKRLDLEDDRVQKVIEAEDPWEYHELFDQPLSWTIAKMIQEETGCKLITGYDSCGDTDQEEYIGICQEYPWNIETKMTKEEAISMLSKYAKELGVDARPEYFTAEYCG